MKICVYAICKNERQFVERWVRSMREADDVVALDTGSTDGTVEALRAQGVSVSEKVISPWRFDAARNESMKLIPADADVCVCTDLDEEFAPGWRAALEAQWRPGAQRGRYRYTWSFNPDGSEGTVLWPDKIHARSGYKWVYPVHEVLAREDGRSETAAEVVVLQGVQLNHHPDPKKSRAQYLPLLELSVLENPDDARTVHYLGREYMFHRQWRKCIEMLTLHLNMPGATWREERCASCRFIARAHVNLGERGDARAALFRAIAEAPWLREPYFEMARLLLNDGEFAGAAFMARQALAIQTHPEVYISEDAAWGDELPRLLERAQTELKRTLLIK